MAGWLCDLLGGGHLPPALDETELMWISVSATIILLLLNVLKDGGGHVQDREDFKELHLFNAAVGATEHVDGIARNQNHGGHRHEPANHLTPQRIHILPQGQRGHLNSTEGEHALKYRFVNKGIELGQ